MEPSQHGIKLSVHRSTDNGVIVSEITGTEINDIPGLITRRVIQTEDYFVREQLKELGWTPPVQNEGLGKEVQKWLTYFNEGKKIEVFYEGRTWVPLGNTLPNHFVGLVSANCLRLSPQ